MGQHKPTKDTRGASNLLEVLPSWKRDETGRAKIWWVLCWVFCFNSGPVTWSHFHVSAMTSPLWWWSDNDVALRSFNVILTWSHSGGVCVCVCPKVSTPFRSSLVMCGFSVTLYLRYSGSPSREHSLQCNSKILHSLFKKCHFAWWFRTLFF